MSATRLENGRFRPRQKQRGASLITAVFLITGLAVLGALMTRMMVMSSTETIAEWYSAQALFAAESGVDWAARYIVDHDTCPASYPHTVTHTATSNVVVANRAWFDVTISCNPVDSLNVYTISSTGITGTNPSTQRLLQVMFAPSN